MERTLGEMVLSDGQWHVLQIFKNGSATSLHVDGALLKLIQHPTQDFGGLNVLTMSLGGVPSGPTQQKIASGELVICEVAVIVIH